MASPRSDRQRPLVIGCGALARELVALTRRAGVPEMDLTCLPATLHNRPEKIPEAVRARIRRARAAGRERIFVAYADCGTGGLLDRALEEEGVERMDGAHCYEVYAGSAAFAAMAEEELGTFYLTDFLVRNFDRLVVRGLGLDRHPELLETYFGNYTRLVYLSQVEDRALLTAARRAATRLGLAFAHRHTGLEALAGALAGRVDRQATIPAGGERARDPGRPLLTRSHDSSLQAPGIAGPSTKEPPRAVLDPESVTVSQRGTRKGAKPRDRAGFDAQTLTVGQPRATTRATRRASPVGVASPVEVAS